IAFPSISTGVFYYPVEQAAKIAVKTVQKYMDENPDAFDLVMWVLFDDNTYEFYCYRLDIAATRSYPYNSFQISLNIQTL
ncbi:MAG: hypothetical protein II433_10420, partial [Acidaminococcaceae bacterium]|nr:hypothetical protein [Acidaminococcaceae bacterium]